MKLALPHRLAIPLAKLAAERAFAEYAKQYPKAAPGMVWRPGTTIADTRFSIPYMGELSGTVTITSTTVEFEIAHVPPGLRFFAPVAERAIHDETARWIAKATRGELT